MKHLLAPTAIIATVAILFAAITPAHACSCAQLSVEESVANADVVIVGKATQGIRRLPGYGSPADFDALVFVEH